MLSGCKPQYCKTVGYTWLYTCDCKAFGSDTRFGDLKGYKILMNKKERWFETAIVCKAAAKPMLH